MPPPPRPRPLCPLSRLLLSQQPIHSLRPSQAPLGPPPSGPHGTGAVSMVTSQTAVPSTRPSQSIWPGRVAGLSSSLAGQGGTRGSGGPVCTSLQCLPRTEPVKCFVTWCGPRAAWAGATGQGEGRGERAGRGGTRTLGGRGTLEGGARHWGLGGWESARDRDLPPWPGLSFPTWKWAGPAGAGHPQSRARKVFQGRSMPCLC